jgi:surfeit locus 1 family protein
MTFDVNRSEGQSGPLNDDTPNEQVALPPASPVKLITLATFAIFGIVVLLALGIWQVERRAWKLDLIERVDSRVHAVPVPAPGPSDWPRINASDDAYRHVRVAGRYLATPDTLVKAVTELGPGYWVLTPFRTSDGFTVLVNRGFVPEEAKHNSAPALTDTTVTGLLRVTEPKGGFLRTNDPAADRWFSRDVTAIAKARGLEGAAPYFIDADASDNSTSLPVGGLTVVTFPNNHLVYALTWFGLALMLAGWSFHAARTEWNQRRRGND